jgi:two-component system chemotaxis response regulator CheY
MSRTILIVDDSKGVREMLRTALEADGYAVAESEDGAQALDACQATRPDLLITDVHMPRMDGLSLVEAVRALPALRFMPILILTTETGEAMKQRGRAAGATGWIVKPFRADRLSQVVARVLGPRGAKVAE